MNAGDFGFDPTSHDLPKGCGERTFNAKDGVTQLASATDSAAGDINWYNSYAPTGQLSQGVFGIMRAEESAGTVLQLQLRPDRQSSTFRRNVRLCRTVFISAMTFSSTKPILPTVTTLRMNNIIYGEIKQIMTLDGDKSVTGEYVWPPESSAIFRRVISSFPYLHFQHNLWQLRLSIHPLRYGRRGMSGSDTLAFGNFILRREQTGRLGFRLGDERSPEPDKTVLPTT